MHAPALSASGAPNGVVRVWWTAFEWDHLIPTVREWARADLARVGWLSDETVAAILARVVHLAITCRDVPDDPRAWVTLHTRRLVGAVILEPPPHDDALMAAVDGLPGDLRSAFTLVDLHQRSVGALAKALNVTLTHAATRLTVARREVAQRYRASVEYPRRAVAPSRLPATRGLALLALHGGL